MSSRTSATNRGTTRRCCAPSSSPSLIGVPHRDVRTDVPQHPEIWGDLCGWYRLPGPVTDVRITGSFGAGMEVLVRGGQLRLRFLTPVPALAKAFPLRPDDEEDPYVFRIDLGEPGTAPWRAVFGRTPGGGPMALHLDPMPVTAYRRPAATNPRRWAEGAAAVLSTAVLARRVGRGHSAARA
jgi:hypothetical protein